MAKFEDRERESTHQMENVWKHLSFSSEVAETNVIKLNLIQRTDLLLSFLASFPLFYSYNGILCHPIDFSIMLGKIKFLIIKQSADVSTSNWYFFCKILPAISGVPDAYRFLTLIKCGVQSFNEMNDFNRMSDIFILVENSNSCISLDIATFKETIEYL